MKTKAEQKRYSENESGFTLMEVIVVIAILGVLTALALPRFTDVVSNSQKKTDLANVRLVESAVELYLAEEDELPVGVTNFEELVVKLNAKGYLKNTKITPAAEGNVFAYDAKEGTVSVAGKPESDPIDPSK